VFEPKGESGFFHARPPGIAWALLLALALMMLVTACGGSGDGGLAAMAIDDADVPSQWQPVDLPEDGVQAIWDTLPAVLRSNADASLFVSAYRRDDGLAGAASILVTVDDASALPDDVTEQTTSAALSSLLNAHEAMLSPEVVGGDPGTYVAAADEPVAPALKSRLVRLLDNDRLLWDSLVFRGGDVLAVTTVWYTQKEGPYSPVEDVAALVYDRLSSGEQHASAE
jgi:hypothetical protein